MKLKLENPNSELFMAIIILKILDVATTYYAVKYFGAEEMNPLAPYVTSNPELMIFGFLGFAAMVSLLYFSQPFTLHGKLKGKRSSQDTVFCSVRLLLPDDAYSCVEQPLPARLSFGLI